MKRDFKHWLWIFAALPLVLAFTGCSDDDKDRNPGDGEKSVYLKILQGGSRGVSDPVADQTVVVFGSGTLYFVSDVGHITRKMTITADPSSENNINLTDIENGYEVTNVPANTKTVHIVGNHASLPGAAIKIDEVKKAAVTVDMQQDDNGGVQNATLYGLDEIEQVTGAKYKAEVELKPHAARIEITDLTGQGDLTDYRVDGIFINNFYMRVQVDGLTDASNLINNESDASRYVGGSSYYPDNLPLWDYSSTGIGDLNSGTLVLTPVPAPTTKVWAYNVLAGTPTPTIVIRFGKVVTNGGELTAPRFLTISGFKNGSQTITAFEGGKIYTIPAGELKFQETDLTSIPEVGTIDVTVDVTLTKWTVQPVKPEI